MQCNCTDADIALAKLRMNAHDIYLRQENRYIITRKIAPREGLGLMLIRVLGPAAV